MMKHIPNIFTLLNLFFGCLAIVFCVTVGHKFPYMNWMEAHSAKHAGILVDGQPFYCDCRRY